MIKGYGYDINKTLICFSNMSLFIIQTSFKDGQLPKNNTYPPLFRTAFYITTIVSVQAERAQATPIDLFIIEDSLSTYSIINTGSRC